MLAAKNRCESRKIEQGPESPTDDVHSVGNAKSVSESACLSWVPPPRHHRHNGGQRVFAVLRGAETDSYTRKSRFVPRFTSSTGSAARRQWSPQGRTGKRSFSTAVDSTVEKEIHPSRGVREDVEAHPAAGDWEQFRQTLRGRDAGHMARLVGESGTRVR